MGGNNQQMQNQAMPQGLSATRPGLAMNRRYAPPLRPMGLAAMNDRRFNDPLNPGPQAVPRNPGNQPGFNDPGPTPLAMPSNPSNKPGFNDPGPTPMRQPLNPGNGVGSYDPGPTPMGSRKPKPFSYF